MVTNFVFFVGNGSGISEDSCDYKSDNNDVTIKQNPPVTKLRISALPVTSRSTFLHVKNCHTAFTPKFVCVRLPVATAIWRTVIHCYCMIVLLTQYVGLVWNSRRYTFICLSFGNTHSLTAARNRLWVVAPSMLTGHQQEPMRQQQ